ncbi:MAG: helix-turn-helix transcriptional regulator [Elusimicrobia bacterium]|nr:helix-turn-helix transcriptional regulator [Elusimicrobiota bacterium]
MHEKPIGIIIKEPKEIGLLLRRIRKEAKLTQQEAAAMCKVGTRFLSELENGKQSLHLGKALKVLQSFGLVVALKRKDLQDG